MRYIPLHETTPDDQAWLDKAEALLQQMIDAPNDDERKKIIDANSRVWGELKMWLLSLSHNKCWFSEARDCFNHWDVEHFRPKKSAKDLDGMVPSMEVFLISLPFLCMNTFRERRRRRHLAPIY